MQECVNCGHLTDTPHCPNCGQKMNIQRVTFKGVLMEFISKWIGFDNQFGRTVAGLITHPDHVVLSYLNGNRVKYIGPLGYVVIMTALLVISFDIYGLEVEDFLQKNQESFNPTMLGTEVTEQQLATQKSIMRFYAANFRFLAAVMIPFFGIGLWFFYRKHGFNYTERLVISSYILCQGIWLTMIMLGVFAATGHLFNFIAFGLSLIYYSYTLHKIFEDKNWIISFFKTFGAFFVAFVTMLLSVMVVIVAIGIFILIKNPDLLQKQG